MRRKATASAQGAAPKPFILDLGVAALSLTLYLFWIYRFRFQGTLADDDLYRLLRGLLDGACSGTGFNSGLHYGKTFSFGYIFALYSLVDRHILQDPQRLIALINRIGFWSAAVGSVFFWASLWTLYGLRRATIALMVFVFSPILLEQGTSGHASLVSFAFFSAATLLVFLPARRLCTLACGILSSLLLLLALTMRADIVLAFPFVVLAAADFRSTKLLIKSALLRTIGPTFAVASFFLFKHIYVDKAKQPGTSLGEFFGQYYKLSHIPLGIGICFLGCGVFTVLFGAWAAIRILRAISAAPPESERRIELLRNSVGPLALVLLPLAFWIADPAPARHFLLCLAGLSILTAMLLTSFRLPRSIPSVHVLSFVIALANQAFGALTGPIILRSYPFKLIAVAGQPFVMPHVPIGSAVSFHRAVQTEMWSADAFAERLREICETRSIVLTDHMPQLSTHIYGWPGSWVAQEGKFHRFSILTARNGNRAIVFLSVHEGWPEDPVAAILAEPALQEFKMVRDPDSLSVFDKTAIPANRTVNFGCRR